MEKDDSNQVGVVIILYKKMTSWKQQLKWLEEALSLLLK